MSRTISQGRPRLPELGWIYMSTTGIIIVIIAILSFCIVNVQPLSLPPIYWNRSNPIFKSSRNDHVIQTQLHDDIDFICPHYHSKHGTSPTPDSIMDEHLEYYLIYQVSKREFEECNAYHDYPLPLPTLNCSQPLHDPPLRFTILLEPVQSIPNTPDYHPGGIYYFITTSTGGQDGLENLYQGACSKYNMKLAIRVDDYYDDSYEDYGVDKYDVNSMLQFRKEDKSIPLDPRTYLPRTDVKTTNYEDERSSNRPSDLWVDIQWNRRPDVKNSESQALPGRHRADSDRQVIKEPGPREIFKDYLIVEPAPHISSDSRSISRTLYVIVILLALFSATVIL